MKGKFCPYKEIHFCQEDGTNPCTSCQIYLDRRIEMHPVSAQGKIIQLVDKGLTFKEAVSEVESVHDCKLSDLIIDLARRELDLRNMIAREVT